MWREGGLCRGDVTRTHDPYVPNVVRYQLRYTPIVPEIFQVCKNNQNFITGTKNDLIFAVRKTQPEVANFLTVRQLFAGGRYCLPVLRDNQCNLPPMPWACLPGMHTQ